MLITVAALMGLNIYLFGLHDSELDEGNRLLRSRSPPDKRLRLVSTVDSVIGSGVTIGPIERPVIGSANGSPQADSLSDDDNEVFLTVP